MGFLRLAECALHLSGRRHTASVVARGGRLCRLSAPDHPGFRARGDLDRIEGQGAPSGASPAKHRLAHHPERVAVEAVLVESLVGRAHAVAVSASMVRLCAHDSAYTVGDHSHGAATARSHRRVGRQAARTNGPRDFVFHARRPLHAGGAGLERLAAEVANLGVGRVDERRPESPVALPRQAPAGAAARIDHLWRRRA
jgi:hypothetical protein